MAARSRPSQGTAFLWAAITLAPSMTACRPSQPGTNATDEDALLSGPSTDLGLASSAFAQDGLIPQRHTEDGEDLSPALTWSGVPSTAKELALICDDPDAPSPEPWVHWVIAGIPATTTEVAEGIPQSDNLSTPDGATQGQNSWGTIGYRGPAPPNGSGVHHYHFKLYALDEALPLPSRFTKQQLLDAMSGHVVANGELVGTYER